MEATTDLSAEPSPFLQHPVLDKRLNFKNKNINEYLLFAKS